MRSQKLANRTIIFSSEPGEHQGAVTSVIQYLHSCYNQRLQIAAHRTRTRRLKNYECKSCHVKRKKQMRRTEHLLWKEVFIYRLKLKIFGTLTLSLVRPRVSTTWPFTHCQTPKNFFLFFLLRVASL
jgi:hypothetical protein